MNDPVDPYRSALVGNCQSAMLVDRDGTVIWGCLPSFHSPSVFGAVLDPDGGAFAIEALNARVVRQRYLPLTNILETRFEGDGVVFELYDWMPRYRKRSAVVHPPVLHRMIRVREGRPRVRIRCNPRPGYARSGPPRTTHLGGALQYDGEQEHFYLQSNLPLGMIDEEHVFTLRQDACLTFACGRPVGSYGMDRVERSFRDTRRYWEHWSRHCHLPRDYQDAILRSTLALKLLTYDDTGAVIAAPTTSLPEVAGESRNWDYRFCWLRDSYFIVRALASTAHFEEGANFLEYIQQLGLEEGLQPVFGVNGERALTETTLEHLRGALGSQPVRVGNQAWEHVQNDVYGEVILTLVPCFFDVRFGQELHPALWKLIRHLADEVCRVWRERDAGIWEYRDKAGHYVFSKMMCWVALTRAAQVADTRDEPALAERWRDEARLVRAEIFERGWSDELQAFTGAYGGETLDAANLLMAHVGFLRPDDPRYLSTLQATEDALVVDGLCFRYRSPDDFGTPRSTFSICTFWYIDALAMTGQARKARRVFEDMLARGNHVGLFSEGIDPKSGAMTGNFPQGYTHVAVINSAMLLAREWGDISRPARVAPAPAEMAG